MEDRSWGLLLGIPWSLLSCSRYKDLALSVFQMCGNLDAGKTLYSPRCGCNIFLDLDSSCGHCGDRQRKGKGRPYPVAPFSIIVSLQLCIMYLRHITYQLRHMIVGHFASTIGQTGSRHTTGLVALPRRPVPLRPHVPSGFGQDVGAGGQCVSAVGHVVGSAGHWVGVPTGHRVTCVPSGQIVETFGQIVDSGGHFVSIGGQCVSCTGHFVSIGGQRVSIGGQTVSTGLHSVGSGGHLVAAGGQCVSCTGHFVFSGGHLVSRGGQCVYCTGHFV